MTSDLASLGWDPYFAGAYAGYDRPSRRPARVIRVDLGICTVLGAAGTSRASLAGAVLAAAADDRSALPCAGDWVVVHTWPDRRVTVEAVLPRRTAVVGPDARVLAANVDIAAVVEPLDREPSAAGVRRLLTLARASGAAPMLILTKSDTVPSPAAVADRLAAAGLDVPVHWVSARTGDGLADLRRQIGPGRTLGLLGPPGAGRSALVTALAGAPVMTGRPRRADGRRPAATAVRTLVPLPGGGVVLDTPAVRRAAPADAPEEADPLLAGTRGPAVDLARIPPG